MSGSGVGSLAGLTSVSASVGALFAYAHVLDFGIERRGLHAQEKGGDGIMSAIDFEMYVDKIPDPKGDRIEGEDER